MFSLAISSICDCWRRHSPAIAAATSRSAVVRLLPKKSEVFSVIWEAEEIVRTHLSQQRAPSGPCRANSPPNSLPYLGDECQPATTIRVTSAKGRFAAAIPVNPCATNEIPRANLSTAGTDHGRTCNSLQTHKLLEATLIDLYFGSLRGFD